MKLLATNNTAINIVFQNLNGYELPSNAQNVDLLDLPDGFGLNDLYKDGYLRTLYDSGDVSLWFENEYRIESDCSIGEHQKDPLSYNYKTELLNGYWYTPEFTIIDEGEKVGTLSKTEYYRNYIDESNKGELVLIVEEDYIIDDSDPSLFYTQRPAIEREKTWSLVYLNGDVNEVKVKRKKKKYNTRRKSHIEGVRRRKNVEEQLIDNVALAGILSGTMTDQNDAFDKLVGLQQSHENAFATWINSGRGTLYDDIANDTTHIWLDDTIPDNATNQSMIPWMIGKTFKNYIVEKLKGNIK